MTLNEAQKICSIIEAKYSYKKLAKSIKWTEVFETENDIVNALKNVYVPKNRAEERKEKSWRKNLDTSTITREKFTQGLLKQSKQS